MILMGDIQVGDLVTFAEREQMLLVLSTRMVTLVNNELCQNFNVFNLTTGEIDIDYGVCSDNAEIWHLLSRLP